MVRGHSATCPRNLAGPSGCGKSTTLRMVDGLEEISGGAPAYVFSKDTDKNLEF